MDPSLTPTPSTATPESITGTTARMEIVLEHSGNLAPIIIDVPAEPVGPLAVLPALHRIATAIVTIAETAATARGRKISCRAGCGACCRQLVPLATVEALALSQLVESMPPARRAAVEARFAAAIDQLEGAGMAATLRTAMTQGSVDYRSLGLAYRRLQIACPFLEDESCSIHAERPLVCREYLVTSPPAGCALPEAPDVEKLSMPSLWRPLAAIAAEADANPDAPENGHVFLVLALEWARNNPPRFASRPGPEWIAGYAGRSIPVPESSSAAPLVPAGGRERVTLDLPPGDVPAQALLPSLWRMLEVPARSAVRAVEADGKQVSCKAGCGACCRQIVPLSLVEARHLAAVIEAMPAQQRDAVRARFEAAEAALDAAGMGTAVMALDAPLASESPDLVFRYFRLGIPCPFLENESCSIHPVRPLICREYLVTSPRERCARLGDAGNKINSVPMPRFSDALLGLADSAVVPGSKRFAMTMLRRVLAEAPSPTTRPAPDWLAAFFAELKKLETTIEQPDRAPEIPDG